MDKHISFAITAAILLTAIVTIAMYSVQAQAQGIARGGSKNMTSGAAANMTKNATGAMKNATAGAMGAVKNATGGK
jgi:hypothetical protein